MNNNRKKSMMENRKIASRIVNIAKKLVSNDATVDDVIGFLDDNPKPSDKKLHEWAEKNGFETHQVEEIVYTLAIKFVKESKNG